MFRTILTYIFIIGIDLNVYAQNGSQLKHADSIRNIGHYEKAIKLYTDMLENVSEKDFSVKSTRTKLLINAFSNRAYCYKKLAKYSLAINDYDVAINLANLIHDNEDMYSLYANKSDLLIQIAAYDEAEIFLKSIPSNINDNRIQFVKAANLSAIYLYQGKVSKAIEILNRIITVITDKREKRIAYQNRAIAYTTLSIPDYARAITDYQMALSLDSTEDESYYIIMSNKAIANAHLGNYEEALNSIQLSLNWFRDKYGKGHPDYIMSLRKLAEIYYLMNNLSKSLNVYQNYFEAESSFVLSNFMSMTEQNRLDFWKKEKPLLSEVFALEKDSAEFLYNVALFRRQVALLGRNDSTNITRKLSISKDNVSKNLGKKDVAIEFVKYEKGEKNRYAALLLSGSDKKLVRFVPLWSEDSIKTYNIDGNRLDSALCSKVRADKDNVYQNEALSAFVWDKLLPLIPEGSTVYFAPDGILHLLAIEYLPSVNNGKYELHRLTTTALLAEKKKKTKKTNTKALVVGGMDYDFITPIDEGETFSANKDAYNYLRQNKKLSSFKYLPGAKAESDSILNYLSAIDRIEDIDESSLKNKLSNYGKVHLATHGYSWHVDVPSVPYAFRDSITEDKSLLASGIALSGVNVLYRFPLRDDGLLSARELCEMNLSGVDLVVASSCQSAQGRVSDEGPTGLVRGLKKAGVKTIIASLWPVSDKATMLLMQFFYDEWREGKGKDGKGCSKTHALHLAQERLKEVDGNSVKIRTYNSSRKTGDYKTITTKYDSPYYWAPFIIIDDI